MGSIDWQLKKTPLECTKYLLENEVNCDVNFRIGEEPENIKAHKLILSMRSPVFDRMFNGCFDESTKDPVIPDVTVGAFKALLRYCYYECLDIEDDLALPVLYASMKYMLPLLEEAARKKLKQIIGVSNVWDIYGYAISIGDSELYDVCKMFFEGDISPVKEALQTVAFHNLPHEVLLDFLHLNEKAGISPMMSKPSMGSREMSNRLYKNNFGISISEIDLFKACCSWAKAECLRQAIDPTGANKRTALGDALSLIRLPTILPKDLIAVVYPLGILTSAEMIHMGKYIHSDSDSECQDDFPSVKRQFVVTAPETSEDLTDESTVFIESCVRVMLLGVWIESPGRFLVTAKNFQSEVSLIMKCNSKYQGHATKIGLYSLYFLDIKPQLLEQNTRYSISVEKIDDFDDGNREDLLSKGYYLGKLTPFKEIKISNDPEMDNSIYALTFCLV